MDQQQLKHLALQVRNQNNGQYREKGLCKRCLMAKAPISSPEDQMGFDIIWHEWFAQKMVKKGICFVCGNEEEIFTLPATQ